MSEENTTNPTIQPGATGDALIDSFFEGESSGDQSTVEEVVEGSEESSDENNDAGTESDDQAQENVEPPESKKLPDWSKPLQNVQALKNPSSQRRPKRPCGADIPVVW